MLDNIKNKNIEILYLLHNYLYKILVYCNNAEDVNLSNIVLESFVFLNLP